MPEGAVGYQMDPLWVGVEWLAFAVTPRGVIDIAFLCVCALPAFPTDGRFQGVELLE